MEPRQREIIDVTLKDVKLLLKGKDEDLLPKLVSFLDVIKLYEEVDLNLSDEQMDVIVQLLQHDSLLIKAKTGKIIASLAKDDRFRQRSVDKKIAPLLCNLIKNQMKEKSGVYVILHSCRALGNLCYENASNRQYVTANDGLNLLLDVIRFVNKLSLQEDKIDINKSRTNKPDPGKKECDYKKKYNNLRSVSLGLLLNYLAGQDDLFPAATKAGVVDLIIDCLSFGVAGKHAETAAVHAITVLSVFAELYAMDNKSLLDERVCKYLVSFLQQSEPGELVELCIDLSYSQSGHNGMPLLLAKFGLVDATVDFVQKYEYMSINNNDAKNLIRVACDLVVIILNDDGAMKFLYNSGSRKEYNKLVGWAQHSNADLRITSILSIGNFARSDTNCAEMINDGIHRMLYDILIENNTSKGDMKIQHALLSAFRNLAIPSRNKEILIDMGIFEALHPMLLITSYPIVFKLIGVMRMLVKGQEKAANELGKNIEVVHKLAEWCSITDHSGITGESSRLIAWIIKNSKDPEVMSIILKCNVVSYLMNMITSQHLIMQGEGLTSLINLTSLRLNDAQETLIILDIGNVLKDYLLKRSPKMELFQCLLVLLEQICSSEQIRLHLRQCAFHTTLKTFIEAPEFTDVKQQAEKLVGKIEKD